MGESEDDRLVVLLHGYQDNAQSMLKRLGWLDSAPPFQWLALNGPFPVPIWNADGFKEAYSWYFRDQSRGISLVEPSLTGEVVAQLIKHLGYSARPLVLFGFSQGGYLAPYVAKHLPNTHGIVGLGCGYNQQAYLGLKPTQVRGIHGTSDERIDLETARREHRAVMELGLKGSFLEIQNFTHKIDMSIEPTVRRSIESVFEESK
jgi:predicted esterase